VTIPASVTTIGSAPFASLYLTEISVDPSNEAYASQDGALFSKDKTLLIAFPSRRFTTYTIPASTHTVGEGAVIGSLTLRAISLPSVVTVEDGAFLSCPVLASVTFGDSLASLGESAFQLCSALPAISLPSSLQEIGPGCFLACGAIREVTLPSGLRVLGANAFTDSGLAWISIPGAIPEIDQYALLVDRLQVIVISGQPGDPLCAALLQVAALKARVLIADTPGFADGGSVCSGSITADAYRIRTTLPANYVPPIATPVPTVDVQRTAVPITAAAPNTKTEINVDDIPPGAPVTISGSGDASVIEGVTADGQEADLHFASLTVTGNEVTVNNLQVDAYLELQEGVTLKPPSGESIVLADDVEIKLVSSSVDKLPQLDLGVTAQKTVPKAIHVVIEKEETEGDVKKLLVKGNPFDNCEDWIKALKGIPEGLEGQCQSASSGRMLADGDRGLYIVTKGDDDSGLPIAIIAAVVAVVVVIVVGIIVYVKCKKGKDDDDSYSDKGRSRSKSRKRSRSHRSHSHGRRHSYSGSSSPSA
jgi:hypothetical protein